MAKKKRIKIGAMYREYGEMEGVLCRNCCNFTTIVVDGKHHCKCKAYGITREAEKKYCRYDRSYAKYCCHCFSQKSCFFPLPKFFYSSAFVYSAPICISFLRLLLFISSVDVPPFCSVCGMCSESSVCTVLFILSVKAFFPHFIALLLFFLHSVKYIRKQLSFL